MRRSMSMLPLLVGVSLLGGCLGQSGLNASQDVHQFTSDSMSPKTVSLVDVRTKQTVWSVEVPVGKQVVVKFENGNDAAAYMPDVMRVVMGNANGRSRTLLTTVPCPGPESRRLEWSNRSGPEIGGTKPSGTTATTPMKAQPTKAEPAKDAAKKPEMIDLPETDAPAQKDPK